MYLFGIPVSAGLAMCVPGLLLNRLRPSARLKRAEKLLASLQKEGVADLSLDEAEKAVAGKSDINISVEASHWLEDKFQRINDMLKTIDKALKDCKKYEVCKDKLEAIKSTFINLKQNAENRLVEIKKDKLYLQAIQDQKNTKFQEKITILENRIHVLECSIAQNRYLQQ